MNDERCDRDRVQAILTLAEAATPGEWEADGAEIYWAATREWVAESLDTDDAYRGEANASFIAASRSETPWLARTLLKALDTIDRARELHRKGPEFIVTTCRECRQQWPCPTWQALNGGNE